MSILQFTLDHISAALVRGRALRCNCLSKKSTCLEHSLQHRSTSLGGLWPIVDDGLVATVLLEDVVTEFDELKVHPMDDPMCRARDCAHYFVDEQRVFIYDGFEIITLQTKYLADAQCP